MTRRTVTRPERARVLRAGLVAAVVGGAPSTAWALVCGDDPMAATMAAGRMLCPRSTDRPRVLVAAGVVHVALSLGWARVIALVQLRGWSTRRATACGVACGAVIATLDLGLAHTWDHERLTEVRALPIVAQVADHLVYGGVVGAVLART